MSPGKETPKSNLAAAVGAPQGVSFRLLRAWDGAPLSQRR